MRVFRWLAVAVGVGLFAWIMAEADLGQVARTVSVIGWGAIAVLAVYFVGFVLDAMVWHLTLPSFPLDTRHLYRAWKARMVGELVNMVTPLGGMGGEPVKAVLLNRHYGVDLREGMASVILTKTIITLSLVLFLSVGFALMLGAPGLSAAYQGVAGAGLAALSIGIVLFFLLQRFRLTSVTASWLSARKMGSALNNILHHIHDVDHRIARFYMSDPKRFFLSVLLALLAWVVGVAEIYVTMYFLGAPVSFSEAWIIESAAQMVRAGVFFIPASLGAQEGAFLLVTTALTGQPALGLAVAVVRRFRELVWLVWGAAIGGLFMRRERFSC